MQNNRDLIAENLRHIHADRHELAKQNAMANPRPEYMLALVRGIAQSARLIEIMLENDNPTATPNN